MLVEDVIFEANVEPKALAWIDDWLSEYKSHLHDDNPTIKHDAFIKRLKKDIINNKELLPHGYLQGVSPLKPYEPKKTDPDYIKNATDPIYTIREDWFQELDQILQDIFSSGERDALPDGPFYKFHNLVKDPDLDPSLKNKLLPLKKKYEQGKFDLPGLKDAMQVMHELGNQRWKYDKGEKQRVETEAPIIMKFENGFMWVRLDSKAEMKREGEMMQNCISGYCPIDTEQDLSLGLRDEFVSEYDPEDQTDDNVYEFLKNWEEENDTTVQDYIASQHDELPGPLADQLDFLLPEYGEMDEEDVFDWMADVIIDADADIETGELSGGHLIYSLRDKHGESHISAEYNLNMDMNNIEPKEALGKQNNPPVGKYGPYIEKLNDFFAENPETFGPKGNTKESVDLIRLKHLAGV